MQAWLEGHSKVRQDISCSFIRKRKIMRKFVQFLVAALVLASVFARRMARPIQEVAATAAKLGRGEALPPVTPYPLEEANALSAAGVRFSSFRVDRPNLEMVFLNLTGRRLRD